MPISVLVFRGDETASLPVMHVFSSSETEQRKNTLSFRVRPFDSDVRTKSNADAM